jgi:hypothetical protein
MITTTYRIEQFIATAEDNGIRNIYAALPRNHKLVLTNRVRQIRTVKQFFAYGFDELGYRVALCADGYIRQLDA